MISIADRATGVGVGAKSRGCVFVMVNSYEARTSHAMQQFLAQINAPTEFILVDYRGGATSQTTAEERRNKNFELFLKKIKDAGHTRPAVQAIDPYSFSALNQFVQTLVRDHRESDIIIDLTCMTKVHAMALGASIAALSPDDRRRFVMSYVIPDAYGILPKGEVAGWQRVIIAPLVQGAVLENERDSRAILLPGFEADRLVAALAEVEPSHGLAIIQGFESRPELGMMANDQTASVLRLAPASQWEQMTCSILDPVTLLAEIGKETELAKRKHAPMFLYAFGPKPTAVLGAFELARKYPRGAWFVYPVPNGYAHIESVGVDRCLWYRFD